MRNDTAEQQLQENRKLQKTLSTLHDTTKELQDNNTILAKDKCDLEVVITRLNDENHELKTDVTRLSVENCELLEEVAELRECDKLLQTRVTELEEHTEASQNTEDVLNQNMEQ